MDTEKHKIRERIQEFKREFQQKKAQGYDVSEVGRLAREAREAHKLGNNQRARQLAKEAITALKNAKKVT